MYIVDNGLNVDGLDLAHDFNIINFIKDNYNPNKQNILIAPKDINPLQVGDYLEGLMLYIQLLIGESVNIKQLTETNIYFIALAALHWRELLDLDIKSKDKKYYLL